MNNKIYPNNSVHVVLFHDSERGPYIRILVLLRNSDAIIFSYPAHCIANNYVIFC